MLRELRIRNFAVIESVTVAFGPGLNVLTGETGAGKSMLIDAILLVRGARAQLDVIRTDADSATVEARFEVAPGSPAAAALDEAGLAADGGEILVRRELARSGRHRAFVNDSPVTVGLLERLGDHLVEVHGQHEHHRLLEPARQLDLLDRFAETEALRERVAALFGKHRAALDDVERTFASGAEALQAAEAQVDDALVALRTLRDRGATEPGRLEAIGDRLDALTRLERKYGDTEEAMLRFRDEAAAELDRLQRHEELLAAQERALGEVWAELGIAAATLSAQRADAARAMAAAAQRELRSLGMDRAT